MRSPGTGARLVGWRKARRRSVLGPFLAAKRVSVQFSRAHWQANEFRSSRSAPRAPHWTFLEEYEALNGMFLTHSVVFTTEFRATQGWAAFCFRNHYSETRFAAIGDPETTPKLDLLPARPQETMNEPPTIPPRPVFGTGWEGLRLGLIAHRFTRTYQRPGRGRAGSRT